MSLVKKAKKLYFAYGSNLEPGQMKERCPDSEFVACAYLPNHRLAFTKPSKRWGAWVADSVFDPTHTVWGVVYEVSESDLNNLDKFEATHSPNGYVRQKVVVYTEKGEEFVTWIYFVKVKQGEDKPSQQYLSAILVGARHHRLPSQYMRFLESIEAVQS